VLTKNKLRKSNRFNRKNSLRRIRLQLKPPKKLQLPKGKLKSKSNKSKKSKKKPQHQEEERKSRLVILLMLTRLLPSLWLQSKCFHPMLKPLLK